MKAMLVPVGEMPRPIDVEGLEGLQRAVGGSVQSCDWIFGDRPAVYVSESGKFFKEPNRAIYATDADNGSKRWDGSIIKSGDLLDILYGDFVCIGFECETGEDRDITQEEAEKVMKRFGTNESIDSGIVEALRIKLGLAL